MKSVACPRTLEYTVNDKNRSFGIHLEGRRKDMKRRNGKKSLIVTVVLLVSLLLAACSETGGTEPGVSADGGTTVSQNAEGSVAELQAQIAELQAENEALRNQLHQYTDGQVSAEAGQENASQEGAQQPAEAESIPETQPAEQPQDDQLNIVVFGDSIWDMDRSDTGIAAQLANYMNANVYNCAIGGTRATLKPGESDMNYDTWDSTSLTGMCYVMNGLVSTNFMEGYPAGGVIRNVNPAEVDYYIIAYGLNDYFSGAPIAVEGGDTFDAHGYTGALYNAMELLKAASPNAQFLLISPTYCQFYENGYMVTDSNMKNYGEGTLTDYANACRNVAEMSNTLYIDAYSTMGINIYTAEEYLEDGVHLTEAGRTLYARAVSSCLKYGKPGEVSGNSVYY